MCGIVGIILKSEKKINQTQLVEMRDSLYHRGPDAEGLYIDTNVGFGHRRLSIIDLSVDSNQPFHSFCGRYILTFNGEIFNYKEFYNELRLKGYKFKTNSDTEVLLNLLIEYGIKCLPRLNGFFAFSFYDKDKRKLYLVRDRFGVKPLFYSQIGSELYFASEPKALFKAGVPKEIEPKHLDELFYYRHVSGANTIFKFVKRILPGYYWEIDTQILEKKECRWFNLAKEALIIPDIKNPSEWFEQTFEQSIRYRMIADVNIGTLLSGGMDSTAVGYTQKKLGYSSLSSWNIRFSETAHDESTLASRFSEENEIDFNSFEFSSNELVKLVLESIHLMDEPSMHMQEGHLLGISKVAKKKVSVLLSGEGSDEILGGYVRYKIHNSQLRYKAMQLIKYLPESWIRDKRYKKLKKYLYMQNQDAQLMMNANELFLKDLENNNLDAFNLLPNYRVDLLREAKKIYPNNFLRQLMYMEQHTHIASLNDRNDRATMGASIECREPFLDHNLVVGIASLEDKFFTTKGKGKKILFDTIGRNLPEYIRNHKKIGLSIPWEKHIKTIPFFREHLDNMHHSELFKLGNYNQINVKQIKDEFLHGNEEVFGLVRTLFFLSLWYKVLFGSEIELA
jgi:asparagine synthase (glutamine-hydrolysing)